MKTETFVNVNNAREIKKTRTRKRNVEIGKYKRGEKRRPRLGRVVLSCVCLSFPGPDRLTTLPS